MSKKKFTPKTEEKKVVVPPVTGKKASLPSNQDSEKKIRKNIYFLIFIVSFMLYGNTIPNEFAMDDELVTLDHPIVSKGLAGIPEIFASRYVQNDQQSYEYRPIVQVSFAIEHQFTGGNVHFSHFINVLLYALTGVLLFQLLSLLFLNFHWILPASITFFFLIHPIHSEVVASLKNRDEILSFLFTLLSIRATLYYFDKSHYKYLIFAFIYFLLAMLSKKSALPLLMTLPVILYFFRNISLKNALIFLLAPATLLFLINFLINSNLESANRPGLYFENPYYVDKPGFIERLPMAFYSMGYYVKLLFLPYPLLVYYGYSHVEIAGWSNIWAILSALFFVGGGIYCLLHLNKKNILAFGFLYFTINIVAFSNLVAMPGIIADRFAYGASLGFSILICYLVLKLLKVDLQKNTSLKIPSGFYYGFIGLFLVCNVYVFQRNKDWKDHLSIYLADSAKAPDSAKIHALIGGYCMQTMEKVRMGKSDKQMTNEDYKNFIALSKKHFTEALRIYPDYVACMNNMGTLYYSYLGETDSAAMYFQKVLQLEPKHVQANFNLGSYHEVQFSAYTLMEKYLRNTIKDDSLLPNEISQEKEIKKYVQDHLKYFRTANLAYTDLSKTFQQFINDNRNSNGQVNPSAYAESINNYWVSLMKKFNLDASQSLNPGESMLQAIYSSNITNQNEFTAMLQNMVQGKFLQQFEPILREDFQKQFNKEVDTLDYRNMLASVLQEKMTVRNKMIQSFDAALFAEKMYAPAFQKLAQIYTEQQMWDSLLSMNKKVEKSDETSRLVDVYRMMGTAYFYIKKENEGIRYFEMAILEEEKILKKAQISLQQQSAAGLNFSVQKLNQLVMNNRGNLYNMIMNLGAMYNAMGNEAKANECLNKSQAYKN